MNNLPLGIQNGIALLTVNRPKSLNVLNSGTLSELGICLSKVGKREDAKVVILTGSGEKSFVTGVDIPEVVNATPVGGSAMGQFARKAFEHLEEMPQVTIIAANRYVLGDGCEILMTCDIRIASESTKFAQPECGLGVLPSSGGTQRLSHLVGKGHAKEPVFICDMIDAQGVYHIGPTDKVVSLTELINYCKAMAGCIMKNTPTGAALAKETINISSDTDLSSSLKLETSLFGLFFSTQDKKEGMTAFLERRREKHFIGK